MQNPSPTSPQQWWACDRHAGWRQFIWTSSSPCKSNKRFQVTQNEPSTLFYLWSEWILITNYTKIKFEHNNPPKGCTPPPVGTVKIYNNDVISSWLAQVMSTKDYWPNINDYLDRLQSTWDKYLGEEYPHKINKNTDAYQKVYTIWYSFHTFTDIILGKSKALWPSQQDKEQKWPGHSRWVLKVGQRQGRGDERPGQKNCIWKRILYPKGMEICLEGLQQRGK